VSDWVGPLAEIDTLVALVQQRIEVETTEEDTTTA
jgi:hypothetical protein